MQTGGDEISVRLEALRRSAFRTKFQLGEREREQLVRRGTAVIQQHAYDLLGKRLAPAKPYKDGRQTPWSGHPVFVAQHATATCCRHCLERWHHIPRGHALSANELDYVVTVVMTWIQQHEILGALAGGV